MENIQKKPIFNRKGTWQVSKYLELNLTQNERVVSALVTNDTYSGSLPTDIHFVVLDLSLVSAMLTERQDNARHT